MMEVVNILKKILTALGTVLLKQTAMVYVAEML
jgi:hypothetical protein